MSMSKYYIYFIAIILIGCNKVKKEYYTNGNIKYEAEMKDGKQNGHFIKYHPNGKIAIEGSFVNNQREGYFKTYFENGILKDEGYYKKGLGNGLMKEYYESGEIKNEAEMIDGKQVGVLKTYFKNGKLEKKSEYSDGKVNGLFVEYFPSGRLKFNSILENDTVLFYEEYDENSKLIDEYRKIIVDAPEQIELGEDFVADITFTGPQLKEAITYINKDNMYEELQSLPTYGSFLILHPGKPPRNFLLLQDTQGNKLLYKEIKNVETLKYTNEKFSFKYKPNKAGNHTLLCICELPTVNYKYVIHFEVKNK